MDVDEAIRTRRTHKIYQPQPVPRDQLDALFELARWAPNHHLTNPWRFRVLGPAALAALKQADPEGAAKLDRAPTLVACSVVQTGDETQDEEDVCAGACAVYTVMLAAHARGIASYWRTPSVLRSAAGRAAAAIAPEEHVLGLLHLGYAEREWQPPQRAAPADFVRFLD
jgi:nitroreductase